MRYDWRVGLEESAGSEAYFKEIDRRFIGSANEFLPYQQIPFDSIIPFEDLRDKDVLEIGIGQGTHAQLLAPRCKSFTGIDLTKTAAEMVAARFKLFKLPGTILQMDAEKMDFPDHSFDYVWSWGVIHHSADTQRVLAEIHRVLRPRGQCTVMVYYRSWWNYYVAGFLRRVLLEPWHSRRSLHQASQSGTDGAIARYYKPDEWRGATKNLFVLNSIRIYGMKSDVVLLPYGKLKQFLMRMLPELICALSDAALTHGLAPRGEHVEANASLIVIGNASLRDRSKNHVRYRRALCLSLRRQSDRHDGVAQHPRSHGGARSGRSRRVAVGG